MDDPVHPTPPRDESIEELDALRDDPARWAGLEPEKLRHLLFYQCLSYGVQPADDAIPGLMALHAIAVDRLDAAVRRDVVVRLASAIHRLHREHDLREGAGCTNALLPFLLEEPDPSVVSSAAAEMAALLPLEQGDPLTGPRYVRSLLAQVKGDDAKAGIIAGLLRLGDARVGPLVAGAWRELGTEGRPTLALLIQGFRVLHVPTVEFLLSWLEDEVRDPHAAAFGVVAATVARAGAHAAEHGITEVRRTFPASDAGDAEPYEVTGRHSLAAFAPSIEQRLTGAAAAEDPPHLMPHVLNYWGFSAAAYRMAAKAAVSGHLLAVKKGGSLVEPVRLDLVPDWPEEPEEETLIEWGIFNPMGPSINTLRLTRVDEGSALIYTLYHPTGSVSRVMALLPTAADPSAVSSAVLVAMAGNGAHGVWLLRSLPDYVHLPAGSPVDRDKAGEAVAQARSAAIQGGDEPTDLEEHALRLRRLAEDPWETTRQEIDRAHASAREGPQEVRVRDAAPGVESADVAGYLGWLAVASSSTHVAAIRSQLPLAWQRAVAAEEREHAG